MLEKIVADGIWNHLAQTGPNISIDYMVFAWTVPPWTLISLVRSVTSPNRGGGIALAMCR